ncbi:hypothetical protein RLW55_01220 [Hyphomicrobium sp. B1]|uniref:hypothetical protein n=1 Tax=unclassified Hyphomicrobium TaxID=2619925 RepID=UPI0039197AD3
MRGEGTGTISRRTVFGLGAVPLSASCSLPGVSPAKKPPILPARGISVYVTNVMRGHRADGGWSPLPAVLLTTPQFDNILTMAWSALRYEWDPEPALANIAILKAIPYVLEVHPRKKQWYFDAGRSVMYCRMHPEALTSSLSFEECEARYNQFLQKFAADSAVFFKGGAA